jgi:hypothetical protein
MAFRFSKRIKIAKGINLNLSKSGIGMSAGVKGFRVGAGPRGARVTGSIPGTGVSHEWRSKKTRNSIPAPRGLAVHDSIPSPHSRIAVLLVCIFLGWFGVHRFVTGRIFTGLIYLLTFGLLGVGWLFDLLRIAFGGFPDSHGRRLK